MLMFFPHAMGLSGRQVQMVSSANLAITEMAPHFKTAHTALVLQD
jgi:hypothetical protein